MELDPDLALGLINAAPDAIVAVNDQGIIEIANSRASELFGYTLDELIGLSVDALVPEVARSAHRAHRTRYGANPRRRQMGDVGARLSAQRADGTLIPVEIALSPVETSGRKLVMAIARDITERLAMEAEHESIRQSLDAVDDAVFMFDPDTLEFSYANQGAVIHTGYGRDELLGGMTPLHIKPHYDQPRFRQLIQPLLDEEISSTTFVTVHRTRDGIDIPVEISLSYPPTQGDLRRPLVALVRDITERQAAEERLRSSEAAFRSAFDDAGVPMAIIDLSEPTRRCIVAVNGALAEMLGFEQDELMGMAMADITHPDDQAHAAAGAQRMLEGDNDYRVEKRFLRSDGTWVWGDLHASLLHDLDQTPRALAHIVNISRRIEAEAERDRREELLASLAAIRKSALNEDPINSVLELVADAARSALTASHCVIATPSGDADLLCRATVSDLGFHPVGSTLALSEPLRAIVNGGEAVCVDDLASETDLAFCSDREELGPALIAPLTTSNTTEGLLLVARRAGQPPFDERDRSFVADLAAEAAVTLVLARARRDRNRMFLAEDRERIARDLHDLVIQQMFATGMRLQAAMNSPELLAERVNEAVGQLDDTIGSIRQTIFHLTRPDTSLAGELERLIDRHRAVGRNDVNLTIRGSIDALTPDVGDHLLPTLNELLSNIERHAQATRADVEIEVTEIALDVVVTDDGVGAASTDSGGFGLQNLARRAAALGGSLNHGPPPEGSGLQVRWTVPLT